MSGTDSLRDSKVEAVLDRLHAAAKGDVWHFAKLAPGLATTASGRPRFP